ncbi:hypothetical protein ZTR_11398 [Talaromyces verruculosus]|nr:hypothetical protein ZTR_11398 [Talaromyces verruculosus]
MTMAWFAYAWYLVAFAYACAVIMDSSMEPIAIVGMACRLPGDANSPSALWQLLVNGRSAHGHCPPTRFSEDGWVQNDFQKRSGYFLTDDIRAFDHEFFGILPTEAACMDPQQRQLLEVVYECFESAGVSLDQVSGSDTGCYVGNFTYDYPVMQSKDPESFQRYSATGMGATILSNRISHAFNMTGPSLVIDTACSSSLYCLHTACNALENSECHAAVVASANLIQSIEQYLGLEKAGVLSPSGKCQTFSHLADGYGRADAVCAVYIKTMKDAVRDNDPIRAVIRGSAIGSNGKTLGLSSPDVAAQQRVILQAYNRSSLKPPDISYVECHGTGTAVGDPVEIEALSRVFQRDSTDRLLIGGLKPNIGHGEAASGLSSVIKVVLALEARQIPPTVVVQPINSSINVAERNLDIVTGLTDWLLPEELSKSSAQVRRAGISAFGYGGANAHVVLEEAAAWVNSSSNLEQCDNVQDNIIASDRKAFLLPFSASSIQSLRARVSQIAAINPQVFDLHSLAYTLGCRRTHFPIRGFLTLREENFYENLNSEMLQTLPSQEAHPPSRPLSFVFTGQGAQWPGMGKELFKEFESFRHAIRLMDSALKQLPHAPLWTLEDIILDTSSSSPIHIASYAQPVTTALQVALVTLLASFDVHPAIVVGHSSGEIGAAFAAGYISLKQAIYVAYYRGYVNTLNERDGLMLAVGLGPSEVLSEIQSLGINDQVQVGCHNSPENVTVTGNATEVRNLSDTLQRRGVFARELRTGSKAYHSHHMLALGPKLEALLRGVPYSIAEMQICATNVQFISTVTGEVKKDGFNESYWRHNMESPVLFSDLFLIYLLIHGNTIKYYGRSLGSVLGYAFGKENDMYFLVPPYREAMAELCNGGTN